MVVGNHQCNAANLNQNKPQFQVELSLAQFSPSLFYEDHKFLENFRSIPTFSAKISISSNLSAPLPTCFDTFCLCKQLMNILN